MPRANRKVLPGFPVKEAFKTRAEVDEYLTGEKVTCLLCGQKYRLLDTHLRAVHSMTSRDYREMYGIPYLRGLCGSERTEEASERMKRTFAEDPSRRDVAMTALKKNWTAGNTGSDTKKPGFWREERTVNTKEMWYEVGQRMIDGDILVDACDSVGVTGYTLLRAARKRWPDLDKWFSENVDPVKLDGRGLRKGMTR